MKKITFMLLAFFAVEGHSQLSVSQMNKVKSELAKKGIKCDKFTEYGSAKSNLDKNLNIILNENQYNILPFSDNPKIHCRIKFSHERGSINVNVSEDGYFNNIRYEMFQSGLGKIDYTIKKEKIGSYVHEEKVARWNSFCNIDIITDDRFCLISDSTKNLAIHKGKMGYSVHIGAGDVYPGKESLVKINKNEPLVAMANTQFLSPEKSNKFIDQIKNNDVVITRYSKWPYKNNIDTIIYTKNIEDYIAILNKLYAKLESIKE